MLPFTAFLEVNNMMEVILKTSDLGRDRVFRMDRAMKVPEAVMLNNHLHNILWETFHTHMNRQIINTHDI